MAKTFYAKSSPYYKTPVFDRQMGYFNKRNIPADINDITYEIEPQYAYRPDLLAYDLYGSAKLWWVFETRNIDSLKDPIFDFVPGLKIKLPQKPTIDALIGS